MTTTTRLIRPFLFVLTSAVLALGILTAARAGHEGHEARPASPAATPAASPAASPAVATVIEIRAADLTFAPREVTIPGNTDVTFRVTNGGALPHDLRIVGTTIATPRIASGASAELTVNLPPGTYQFICSIPGHRQAGMLGTIIVD